MALQFAETQSVSESNINVRRKMTKKTFDFFSNFHRRNFPKHGKYSRQPT